MDPEERQFWGIVAREMINDWAEGIADRVTESLTLIPDDVVEGLRLAATAAAYRVLREAYVGGALTEEQILKIIRKDDPT